TLSPEGEKTGARRRADNGGSRRTTGREPGLAGVAQGAASPLRAMRRQESVGQAFLPAVRVTGGDACPARGAEGGQCGTGIPACRSRDRRGRLSCVRRGGRML
ncbi:MAG: hypothetical protein PHE10_10200, partial [Kiritimatiellae bacterium]|nr:hypothetical protein [Kiritimatiellia bacterium]